MTHWRQLSNRLAIGKGPGRLRHVRITRFIWRPRQVIFNEFVNFWTRNRR